MSSLFVLCVLSVLVEVKSVTLISAWAGGEYLGLIGDADFQEMDAFQFHIVLD